MKKLICLLISIVMLLMACSALAEISVSWSDGKLTVSTTDTEGMNMILIDGQDTGKFVGDTSPSQVFSVPEDGQRHTVTTIAYFGATGGSASFVAGVAPTDAPTEEPTEAPTAEPTVEPTEEPTIAPTVEPTEEPTEEPTPAPTDVPTPGPKDGPLAVSVIGYEASKLTFSVSNLAPMPGEAWIDGVSTGITVYNGVNTITVFLKEGTYTLTIHGNGETASDIIVVKAPENPVISNASYANGTLSFDLDKLNGLGEIWVSDQNAGTASANGRVSVRYALVPGDYTVMVYDSMYALRSNTLTFHVHRLVAAGEAKAPTCTEEGLTAGIKCSLCNEIIEAQQAIPALGHDWGEWKVTKEPGVGVKGEETRVCKNDESHIETREIDALGEDWDDGVVTKEPTCEEEGIRTYTSKNDPNLTKDVAIPALGHTPEVIPAVEPTCTTTGLTEGEQCSVCGKITKEQEEIPALGHMYISQRAESLTRKKYICARCGDVMYMDANVAIENLYGSILRNALGEDVNYVAQMDAADNKVLVITATIDQNNPEWVSEIGMYLTKQIIADMRSEGFEYVKYVNEGASLVFALDDLKDELYPTNDVINEYVITLDPRVEGGCLVSLDATIGDNQKIPAQTFIPMKLNWNNHDIEVTAQGIYNE